MGKMSQGSPRPLECHLDRGRPTRQQSGPGKHIKGDRRREVAGFEKAAFLFLWANKNLDHNGCFDAHRRRDRLWRDRTSDPQTAHHVLASRKGDAKAVSN